MDAAVHPFLASPPMLAAYPKLLATKNHLRVFQGRLISIECQFIRVRYPLKQVVLFKRRAATSRSRSLASRP